MISRSIFTALLLFSLVPIYSISQENIEVIQKSVSMSQGEQPAYIVNVPQSDYELVLNAWKKVIRQNTKSKVEEKEHELFIAGTQITSIHHKPINIYSAVINKDSVVKVVAVYEIDSVFFAFSEEEPNLKNEKTISFFSIRKIFSQEIPLGLGNLFSFYQPCTFTPKL